MGNTVKTPRASEETNMPSQTGKLSFHSFQEKEMFTIYDRLSHVSVLTRLTKAGKFMAAVGEGGHPPDCTYI